SVVSGKGFVHMLRAFTLWLAAVPVLTVPFLLGGVGWLDVTSAFALQFCAILLALGAGLIASGMTLHPAWSVIAAELLSLCFWTGRFAWYRRRVLDRNPMGWLERYATRRSVTALVWSCVIMLVDSWLIARRQPWTYFEFAQMWIAILLTLNLTFEAATLFRQERYNGVLELLLVTPLSVDRLVIARLSSFWKRFFPPVALALGLSTLMIWLDLAQPPNWNFRIF